MLRFLIPFIFLVLPLDIHAGGFVWTQLNTGGECDPYPGAYRELLAFLGSVTSVEAVSGRKFVDIKDDAMFESPFLFLACRSVPRELDDEEIRRLRMHLAGGGMLWIEDVSGQLHSSFDRWVRRTLAQIFPESRLQPIDAGHPVYRSFFLIKSPEGRTKTVSFMEGVQWGGRTAVIYSRNDLPGAWPKDALGNPLYQCAPGGEAQRSTGKKLSVNIIMYSLTGSYKLDAIHQPFILEKLRQMQAQ